MDHIADKNLTVFHQIRSQHDLPDFVKSAKIDHDVIDSLPPSSFADPATRQFPCHTRADTFLSYAYFLKSANDIPKHRRTGVWERLRKRAHHWAIFSECEKLVREHEKQASSSLDDLPDEKFAIVEQLGGEKYRALPLLNEECVKSAAEHLMLYRDRYPMEWRRRAAEKISQAARDTKAEINDYIPKAAGELSSCRNDIAEHMFGRVLLTNPKHRGNNAQVAMAKAAKAVATSTGRLDYEKIANIIDAFDSEFKLTRFYNRGLLSPEEIVFGSRAVKQANDIRNQIVKLTTGSTYTKASLEAAGLEPYAVLGSDFVNEIRDGLNGVDIEKISSIVPTLPRDDAQLLDKALRATGVKSADTIRKEAGLPSDMGTWSQSDWDRFYDMIGA